MDHEAIGKHAAERYILAEMSESERDAFEEHYFDCVICAEDVRALDALREELREQPVAVAPLEDQPGQIIEFRRRMVPQFVPWATAAALLLGVGYDNLVRIPRLVRQIPPVVQLVPELYLTSATRAEAGTKTFPANTPGTILIDVVAQPEFVAYHYRLRRGAEVLGEGPIPVSQLSESVPLQVRSLPAGRYEVVIEGVRKEGNRSEITRLPFDVVDVVSGVRAEEAP